MSRGRRVNAATLIAAAFVVGCVCMSPSSGRAGDDDDAHFILFSGRDIWRNGLFAHGGLLWSPGGMDEEGFTLKALISGGLYRYQSGALGDVQVYGVETVAQVLPGWRFKRDRTEIKLFAGLDLESHGLWPDDPSNSLHGRALGLRIAADLWYEPTDATMFTVDGSLSTIATSHSARAAYGWKVFDEFYVGPEIQYFAAEGYRHLRLGAHITGMQTGNYEWSAAGGWAMDSDRRESPYLRLGVLTRQ